MERALDGEDADTSAHSEPDSSDKRDPGEQAARELHTPLSYEIGGESVPGRAESLPLKQSLDGAP